MRYRCTNCGSKCTVSVRKGNVPIHCPVNSENTAIWMDEKNAPSCKDAVARVKNCMTSDARGFFIRAIDPMNRGCDIVFRSINEAADTLNISKGSISRAVKSDGSRRAGAYYWKREFPTAGQLAIRKAAQTSVDAYRQALKEHDPERFKHVFGEVE